MKQSKLVVSILVLLLLSGSFLFFLHRSQSQTSQQRLTLALDWTPNTNHTGVYVALHEGWYKAAGIDLKILPYSASVSPDTLVANNKADLGISSTEGIVADAGAGSPVISIGAIVAHNTSELAVRKDSGITSPRQLDGKTYGGFGAAYESAEVGAVIKDAGGTGEFKNVTLDSDPLQALTSKQVDFVWIFAGWEAIQAQRSGLALTTFPISRYGLPDYPTPNFITSAKTAHEKPELVKKFMSATAAGYEYARNQPKDAARILIAAVPAGTFPDPGLVAASQAYLSPRYQDAHKAWGVQTPSVWSAYTGFMLTQQGVLDASGRPVDRLAASPLFSNQFLP